MRGLFDLRAAPPYRLRHAALTTLDRTRRRQYVRPENGPSREYVASRSARPVRHVVREAPVSEHAVGEGPALPTRREPRVDGEVPNGSQEHGLSIKEPRRTPSRILCPSSRSREGSLLLGIIDCDGVVGYVRPPLPVGAEFVQAVEHQNGTPEHRFRFAAPCLETGCLNWSGTRCGVIDGAASNVPDLDVCADTPLPRCDIRPSCRWFAQVGARACSVCPQIFNFLGRDAAERQASESP